jgi:hypothetical protein
MYRETMDRGRTRGYGQDNDESGKYKQGLWNITQNEPFTVYVRNVD